MVRGNEKGKENSEKDSLGLNTTHQGWREVLYTWREVLYM